jgi:hypothetical protein
VLPKAIELVAGTPRRKSAERVSRDGAGECERAARIWLRLHVEVDAAHGRRPNVKLWRPLLNNISTPPALVIVREC